MSFVVLRREHDRALALSGEEAAAGRERAVPSSCTESTRSPAPESAVRPSQARDRAPGADLARARSTMELPLEAAKAGDPNAIRQIVESLMPDAFRIAVSILGKHHPEVDDAVQVGILTVIEQLGSFRGDGGFRSFAMRIVSRKALALRRNDKRTARLAEKIRSSENVEPDEEPTDESSDPVDASLRRLLSELLQTLPEEQAETLLLRVVLEYDLTAVAAETGVPVNTVRSRLRLAREELRRKIEGAPHLMELAEGRTVASTKGESDDE